MITYKEAIVLFVAHARKTGETPMEAVRSVMVEIAKDIDDEGWYQGFCEGAAKQVSEGLTHGRYTTTRTENIVEIPIQYLPSPPPSRPMIEIEFEILSNTAFTVGRETRAIIMFDDDAFTEVIGNIDRKMVGLSKRKAAMVYGKAALKKHKVATVEELPRAAKKKLADLLEQEKSSDSEMGRD